MSGIALVAAALSLVAALRIRPDASLSSMMAADSPAANALHELSTHFSVGDELMIVVSVQDSNRGMPDLVAFARRLETTITENDGLGGLVTDVNYRTDAHNFREFVEHKMVPNAGFYFDERQLNELLRRLTFDGMRAALARAERLIAAPGPAGDLAARSISRDPLFLHEIISSGHGASMHAGFGGDDDAWLSSHDKRSLLIKLRGREPVSDLEFSRTFVESILDAARKANHDQLRIELTGAYAIAQTAERSIRRDMIVSVAGSMTIIIVLFLAVFRRPALLPLLIAPASLGILFGFGAFSLFSTTLTPLTAVVGAVVAGLGVDFAIHFLSHVARLRRRGQDARSAVIRTRRAVARPVLIAAATSVAAFGSLMVSTAPAVRDFGLLGALGLAGAFASTYYLLPSLCMLMTSATNHHRAPRIRRHDTAIALVYHIRRHRRVLLLVSAFLVGAALWTLRSSDGRALLPLDADPHILHPQPNRPLELQNDLPERFAVAGESWPILIEAPTSKKLIERAHDAEQRLISLAPLVRGTVGIQSLLPDSRVNAPRRAMLSTLDADTVLEAWDNAIDTSIFDPDSFEEYRDLLARLASPQAPPGLEDLTEFPELSRRFLPNRPDERDRVPYQALMLVELGAPVVDARQRNHAIESVKLALDSIPGATLTGMTVVGLETQRSIRRNLTRGVIVAIVVICVILMVMMRRPLTILLVLIPTVAGVLVVIVFVRLTGISFNLVSLMGLPLLIGLGLDDGVFLVCSRRTLAHLASSCQAILLTSATTALGFGSLALTSSPAVRTLGLLTVIGITGCLLATLVVVLPITCWRKR